MEPRRPDPEAERDRLTRQTQLETATATATPTAMRGMQRGRESDLSDPPAGAWSRARAGRAA